jgi:hypothetical protein
MFTSALGCEPGIATVLFRTHGGCASRPAPASTYAVRYPVRMDGRAEEMLPLRISMLVSFLVALVAAEPGSASYLLTLSLASNEYTTTPGGQFTLRGFFTTEDALTFTYSDDRLFGLTAASPHLDVLAGSVLLSQNFDPPVGGVYFADEFGGGYLGPTVDGPAVTFVTDLRTFAIPLGTPPGTYRYSYGVDLFPTVGGAGSILYDSLLTIHVIPEPSSWVLLMVAFGALDRSFAGGCGRNPAVRQRRDSPHQRGWAP